MKNHPHILFLLAFTGLLFLQSCNLTKRLGPEEKLLNKVNVEVEGKTKVDKDELKSVVKQKPNRGLVGNWLRFNLWFYNLYKKESEAKLKSTIGEAPVIHDPNLTERSQKQISLLLENKGYFENKVESEIEENEKGDKVDVTYLVKPGPAYKIGDIMYDIDDENMMKIIRRKMDLSKIKTGDNFDIDKIRSERTRITKLMRNNGYFYFNEEFVYFTADSSNGKKHNIDLETGIKKFAVKSPVDRDSIIRTDHKVYRINNIYIRQDYRPDKDEQDMGDTITYKDYHFIQQGEPKFKPKALAQQIFLKKGDLYRLRNHDITYKRLSSLQNFGYINIRFEKTNGEKNLINCYINLSPIENKSISFETVGTNNAGNFGIEGNIGFQHKNIFHGAEKLSLRMGGKIEAQPVLTKEEEEGEIIRDLPFNTFEFGPELSLDFPKFLLPISQERFSKRSNPKTNFNLAYNFQERPAYIRHLYRGSFGYNWNETEFKRHIVTPVSISSIKLDPSPSFEQTLEELSDPTNDLYNPFILNSYQDHLITSSKYSFIFSDQGKKKKKNFSYFRGNIEFAGNLLHTASIYLNAPRDDQGNYKLFGIRFAQFIRPDIDYRYYIAQSRSTLVFRFASGIGIAYGNSRNLPFEKSFYAGGANGIRAWRARDLGPGSLPDTLESNIDRIGEMNLEGNIEYRFDITGIFEGATFIDMGNIWNLEEEVNRPNAEFDPGRLWQDLAIGVGLGLRLDFNFFIIRFDLGVPLKNPGSENPKQLKLDFSEPPLNIGIGYPF